jgi:hypothetical protein
MCEVWCLRHDDKIITPVQSRSASCSTFHNVTDSSDVGVCILQCPSMSPYKTTCYLRPGFSTCRVKHQGLRRLTHCQIRTHSRKQETKDLDEKPKDNIIHRKPEIRTLAQAFGSLGASAPWLCRNSASGYTERDQVYPGVTQYSVDPADMVSA